MLQQSLLPPFLRLIFAVVLGATLPAQLHAQQESLADRLDREIRSDVRPASKWEKMHAAMIGKQFWLEAHKNGMDPLYFHGAGADGKLVDVWQTVFGPTTFTVIGFTVYEYNNYVKVTFVDGRAGFIKESFGFDRTGKLFDDQFDLGDKTRRYDFKNYLFSSAPETVFASERAAADQEREVAAAATRTAKAAEAVRKARGGVRIGMTMKQVRASSWGTPQDVHRMTSAQTVTEQWVYGDGNYLYFENGILNVIQN
jgi:hypothetical protein